MDEPMSCGEFFFTVFVYVGKRKILHITCWRNEICPGLKANEIQIPYDKHHKVSSLVKSHLNRQNLVKYEVVWKFQIWSTN